VSEQTDEDRARIAKEWDEAIAKIKAEKRAAGLIDCPRCDGDGLNDEDIDDGTDCCRMCNGGGYFHAKDLIGRCAPNNVV
jgi:DnaJ-class molecular chaperone